MRFTPDNARQFSVKGLEVRRRNRELAKLRPKLPPLPDPIEPTPVSDPSFPRQTWSTCARHVLAMQNHLTALLEKKFPDWQQANWLASALERIAELERILSGRPLPGSLRPGTRNDAARARNGPSLPSPAIPDQPQVSSAHAPPPSVAAPASAPLVPHVEPDPNAKP
jgi:hypothetical protein